jgi:hypothetical protein
MLTTMCPCAGCSGSSTSGRTRRRPRGRGQGTSPPSSWGWVTCSSLQPPATHCMLSADIPAALPFVPQCMHPLPLCKQCTGSSAAATSMVQTLLCRKLTTRCVLVCLPVLLQQVRVVQRNLVYAVGLPLSLCREEVSFIHLCPPPHAAGCPPAPCVGLQYTLSDSCAAHQAMPRHTRSRGTSPMHCQLCQAWHAPAASSLSQQPLHQGPSW